MARWRHDADFLADTVGIARFQQIIHLYQAKRSALRSAPMLKSGSFQTLPRPQAVNHPSCARGWGARLWPRALLQIGLYLLRTRGNETLTERDSI
jgi:hypothetical protein